MSTANEAHEDDEAKGLVWWHGGLISPRLAARLLGQTLGVPTEPHPVDLPSVYRAGESEVRILVFGNGPVESAGVRTHELGLAGGTATALQQRLDRGVLLDVLIEGAPTRRAALAAFAARRVWRYDAVVVTLDLLDASRRYSPSQWRREIAGLISAVQNEVLPTTPVLIAPHGAQDVRTEMLAVTTVHAEFAGFDLLELSEGSSGWLVPATARYAEWGDRIAERLQRGLSHEGRVESFSPSRLRELPDDEVQRQAALIRSGLLGAPPDPYLQRVVDAARTAYNTAHARINIITADTQYAVVSTSGSVPPSARSDSICDHTIRSPGLTVVHDTAADARFADHPFMLGPEPARFYAGVPLESPDGYRIGTVCVYDPVPRTGEQASDVAYGGLRDLAFLVQRHVWEGMAHEHRSR